MEKHLTLQDMTLLSYHLEFKDILEDNDYNNIINHLDNCESCKNRFSYKDTKVIDNSVEIIDKLNHIYLELIMESAPKINSENETSKNIDIMSNILIKKWDIISRYLYLLRNMGITAEETMEEVKLRLDTLLKKTHYYELK